MINDKGILIKNIYYMLTYAFQILKQKNYENISAIEFDNAHDLFAAILNRGVAQQLKQGIYREYIDKKESLTIVRGKLNITGVINNRIQHSNKVECDYDDLSANNIFNKILKTTLLMLLRSKSVKRERKIILKKLLMFFSNVEVIDTKAIPWTSLIYKRNNRSYELLMNICYFLLNGMLQKDEKGNYKSVAFTDENMAKLFEKFVLEYYRQRHHELSDVRAARVAWNIGEGTDEKARELLPNMQTDITLCKDDKILIIDTKYYGQTMQQYYDKQTLRSANLYQIYAYVKNMDVENTGNVSGLLLYAKTSDENLPVLESA